MKLMNKLVLLRHGQSQWNLENRFTGWKDVPLTEKGINEANNAGHLLKKHNIKIDKVFSSVLERANKTAEIAIKASEIENLHKNGKLIYEKDQNLNERDYGDLVGLNKAETADKFGKEQVHIWRRSYDTPPPNGESLKDVVDRVSPYFTETIQPHILNKKNVLIAAHGNSLRAIMIKVGMYQPEEMPIPHAFEVNDWDPPEYVKIAEKDRAKDKSLGKKAGYSLAVSKQEALEARALTGGMISMIDDAVGKVRDALVASQLETKTVQIYTSDHGDHLGDHRLLFKGAEQYDTITHVPFIWADPQGKKGGRSSDLAQTLDIGTTILEHAKVEATEGMQGQVMSVAGGAAREVAFIQYDNQRTQEAFGKEPRVHTIIHRQYRLSVYRGICENELFDLICKSSLLSLSIESLEGES